MDSTASALRHSGTASGTTMSDRPNRFVFVAGLHRTGTSLTARLIAAHPHVSAIRGSGAPEDEGCYLQGAIPHDRTHGIPGEWATDPAQRHDEASALNTLETRNRLLADWSPWFDADKPWWLEKSPVNLTRMRLLQQLLPMAHFIVVLRHPQAMAAALAKWSERSAGDLIDYALDAYEQAERDAAHLHHVMLMRYEDLVTAPQETNAALHRFLALEPVATDLSIRDGNSEYDLSGSITELQAERMARWGYAAGGGVAASDLTLHHPLRAVRERVSAAITKC